MLVIVGNHGLTTRVVKESFTSVLNRETGLFDQIKKRTIYGPLIKLKKINSGGRDFFEGRASIDKKDYFNLETGKALTYKDAILSLNEQHSGLFTRKGGGGERLWVQVTTETKKGILEAVKEGFPKTGVYDPKGLLDPSNKLEDKKKEIKIDYSELKDEEVDGIKDLKSSPKKPVATK